MRGAYRFIFQMKPNSSDAPPAGRKDSKAALRLVDEIDPTGSAPESSAPALTDIGNGERFAIQHGPDIRFCADYNKFFHWTALAIEEGQERESEFTKSDTDASGDYKHLVSKVNDTLDDAGRESVLALSPALRQTIYLQSEGENTTNDVSLPPSETQTRLEGAGANVRQAAGITPSPQPAAPTTGAEVAEQTDPALRSSQDVSTTGTVNEVPSPKYEVPQLGGIWRVDNIGEVMRRAKTTAQSIFEEMGIPNRDYEATKKWAVASQEESSLKSMLGLAKSEWPIPVTPAEFDRNPWLLNLQNGTVDLTDGTFREANREDLITQVGGTWYDPHARCDRWFLPFLKTILPDPEVQEFIRRMMAYCLTGVVNNPRALFILCGRGLNGKTTLIETLKRLLGTYAWTTPVETLLARNQNQIPNDIAALKGRRMVTASETEEGGKLSFSKLKRMSGGSVLVGRKMRGEFEEFEPTFKLILDTNHAPDTSKADQAFFDRLKLVPFPVRVSEPDPYMKEKLCSELPGILNWILAPEGLAAWRDHGIGDAGAITEAAQTLRAEHDRVGRFLDEYYVLDATAHVTLAAVHKHYLAVMQENNEKALGKTNFGSALRERGYRAERLGDKSGTWAWCGLRLRDVGEGRIGLSYEERERKRLEEEEKLKDDLPF